MPSEVLVIVFQHLDLASLLLTKVTCKAWLELIDSSVILWKARIRRHCCLHPAHLPLLSLPLFLDIRRSATRLQKLARRLARLHNNIQDNKCKVVTINCLEAEYKGKRVEVSEEWERNHNYKGVYDMILDNNRLIASVYDTIQVWDLATYQMTNLLNPKSLDTPLAATTCFAVLADLLVCGTQNGLVKLVDMKSGEVVATSQRNSSYISDVAVVGETVVSVDWYGEVTVWRLRKGQKRALDNVTGEGRYTVPAVLGVREVERLLDFTDQFLVTTFKCHLTCYRKGEFFRSYPAYSDVFCINIMGDRVAFGCKGDRSSPVAGIMKLDSSGPPRVVYLKTSDNDPVISICLQQDLLTLGDVNGELHRVDVTDLKFPDQGEVIISLENKEDAFNYGIKHLGTLRTHAYRDFVWAVKGDSYRIFSGDETGKIMIHDYLMLED